MTSPKPYAPTDYRAFWERQIAELNFDTELLTPITFPLSQGEVNRRKNEEAFNDLRLRSLPTELGQVKTPDWLK